MAATRSIRPTLETLEDRLVQTTAVLSAGLLIVNGSQGDDAIVVRQVNNYIRVSGVATRVPVSQVRGIVVDGLNGNDRIVLSSPELERGVQHLVKPTLLMGGNGADQIYGGSGNDLIAGGAGNDRIWGSYGQDVLVGNAGDDVLDGGRGNDRLFGSDGDDVLFGGWDRDFLDGGLGSDVLEGGLGADLLWGGADTHTDVFYNPDSSDTLFTNYGEDAWYSPSTNTAYYVPKATSSSSQIPSSAISNPNSYLANVLGPELYNGIFVQRRFPNYYNFGA